MKMFGVMLLRRDLVFLFVFAVFIGSANGIGVNWGNQATHPLPPATVVRMLRDNGFQKVKLFDADSRYVKALGKSGIQVMVGIPNDMLATLASSVQAAENWVAKNVSAHVSSGGVDIRLDLSFLFLSIAVSFLDFQWYIFVNSSCLRCFKEIFD